LLARDALRYKRQIISLKNFFLARRATALLLDDRTSDTSDLHVQSSAHGVILMEQLTPEYGVERRRLRVMKLRGAPYRGGFHDYMIETGGLSVFPRLVAAEHRARTIGSAVSSCVAELDDLFGGGVERGTSTLIMGPAGSGKSTIALQFAVESARRGEKVAMYNFDEGPQTLRDRARSLGMDLDGSVDNGLIRLEHIDPAELSPGEFVQRVCAAVLHDNRKLVVIDTLNGFLNAMPGEKYLTIQLHELLTFLGSHGVVTILVLSQYGVLGSSMQTPVDVSYLADSVLLVRYFEHEGAVKLALSAVKKRSGKHERTIREFELGTDGIRVGKPLSNLHGVLTGVPILSGYSNGNSELLPERRNGDG
jgi:circadian clock protein KaiC